MRSIANCHRTIQIKLSQRSALGSGAGRHIAAIGSGTVQRRIGWQILIKHAIRSNSANLIGAGQTLRVVQVSHRTIFRSGEIVVTEGFEYHWAIVLVGTNHYGSSSLESAVHQYALALMVGHLALSARASCSGTIATSEVRCAAGMFHEAGVEQKAGGLIYFEEVLQCDIDTGLTSAFGMLKAMIFGFAFHSVRGREITAALAH